MIWFVLFHLTSCFFYVNIFYNASCIFSGVFYFRKGVKNPVLIYNHFEYTMNGHPRTIGEEQRTYWKCLMYSRTKCHARLIVYGNSARIGNEIHNHEPPKFKYVGMSSKILNVCYKHRRL